MDSLEGIAFAPNVDKTKGECLGKIIVIEQISDKYEHLHVENDQIEKFGIFVGRIHLFQFTYSKIQEKHVK